MKKIIKWIALVVVAVVIAITIVEIQERQLEQNRHSYFCSIVDRRIRKDVGCNDTKR